MYLKGSKWNLRKRKKNRRVNPALVVLLLILIGATVVFNQFIIPQLPDRILPTPTPTQNPVDILAEAEINFDDGNMVRAVELYSQAVQLDPTNHLIYITMARTQIFASLFEAAQTSATNALLLSPNNVEALTILGSALTYLEDYDKAKETIETALSLSPEDGLAHAAYAELMISLDDVELASQYSLSALAFAPNSFEAHRARGFVFEETQNAAEALAEYLLANQINDSVADLHIMLGRTYWALDMLDEAIEEFNQADGLNPSDSIPETYITMIYLNQGEFSKAIQSAKAARDDEPGNPFRHGNLGLAYYRNGDYQDAVDAFTFFVHGGSTENGVMVVGVPLDYAVADYFYFYGFALLNNRRCAEAVPIFEALLSAVPDDGVAFYNATVGIAQCEEIEGGAPAATETSPDSDSENDS